MGDVTGPISTLPGKLFKVPENARCDEHPDILATKRVQGETDSFGCEMHDMCDECYIKYKAHLIAEQAIAKQCDWCKTISTETKLFRDPEEGIGGPVYRVCMQCRIKAINAYYR